MTNLEKLMEVFGCKVVREINKNTPKHTIVKVDLDCETSFYKSWCDEEYKAPSENVDEKTELDIIKHNIDDLCVYLDKRLIIYTERFADLEHNISKCWNRIGKEEQKLTELDTHLSRRIDSIERRINNLTPPLKEQTEEEFLKSLRSIKVVRIK